ncbi:O-acyltransferase WSD1, C-terminal [Sergentomyia squamirostris]
MSWLEKVQNSSQNWIKIANETFNSDSIRNFQEQVFKASTATTFSPSQLGILSGILIALLVNAKNHKQHQKFINNLKSSNVLSLVKVIGICFVVVPLFVGILGIFLIYRSFVNVILNLKYGTRYRGILDANDAIWTVEDHTWKSVINILAILEGQQPNKTSNNPEDIVLLIQEKFRNLQSYTSEPYRKVYYKLNRELGYSFWTTDNINIDNYVRLIEVPCSSEYLNLKDLQLWLENTSNNILPNNHSALWEILISSKPFKEDKKLKYPIICRVHHSLGDGVALLRFFLEAIADQDATKTRPLNHHRKLEINVRKTITELLRWTKLIGSIPFHIVQHFSDSSDNNTLHGPRLSGQKVSAWFHESSVDLLPRLRKLKRTIPHSRFSDIILTALSASLNNHFKKVSHPVPEVLRIIVPARIEAPSTDFRLENKFSVAVQKLPIIQMSSESLSVSRMVTRVKRETDLVRSKPDYVINYGIMRVFGYLLPYPMLSGILDSKLATMVFSNLPGPVEEATLGNYRIANLSFSVPHRDLTGVGFTLLTYAGRIQIAICADKNLISSALEASKILQDTYNNLKYFVTVSE